MKARHHSPRRLALSALSLALLAALSLPAFAADPVCVDSNGIPTGATTNQGNENGTDNATCTDTSSAYGEMNNASAAYSSAFGFFNFATGFQSSAFGNLNLASGYASSAFGFGGSAYGAGSLVFSGWWERNGDGFSTNTETSYAAGASSVSMGANTRASDNSSVAIGVGSEAGSPDGNFTNSRNSIAVGTWFDLNGNGALDPEDRVTSATGVHSAAIGVGSQASGDESTAVGVRNFTGGSQSSAFGFQSQALANSSTALGF